MNDQLDWVGGGVAASALPFRDIRSTRPSVAEEKAELALRLGALINKVPPKIASGSINITREWRSVRDKGAKVAANKRASVQELHGAINNFHRFFPSLGDE